MTHTHIVVPATQQRYLDTRRAFDGVAGQYRGPLGNNCLVVEMRRILWRTVETIAPSGGSLLDLGCGTGLDAVFFAGQGYHVTAIDWSPEMVAQTRASAEATSAGSRVRAVNLGIQELAQLTGRTFDCIYSNLGALNCVADLAHVAQDCKRLLKPNGTLVFSVIGRHCPWELAYYGLRGDWQRMKVRWQNGQMPVSLNGRTVWTRYYSPKEFYSFFAPRFEWRQGRGLNLFLPPPYLAGPFEKRSWWLKPLAWLDDRFAGLPLANQMGDHFLLVMSPRSAGNQNDSIL